jgi:P-type Cu+ transporter
MDPVGYSPYTNGAQTVSFRVDGMFVSRNLVIPACSRFFSSYHPDRVTSALQSLGTNISIVKLLLSRSSPVVTIVYHRSPPSFTICTIMSIISSTSSPPLNISVYLPPSVEQLACHALSRQTRALSFRVILSTIITFPAFILGIYFTKFVPANNVARLYLTEPMWIGNVSRVVWALLFLATPVMFYSASIYHHQSLKEIYSLWKRGSPTLLLHRFTRFGSMDLLASLFFVAMRLVLSLIPSRKRYPLAPPCRTLRPSPLFFLHFSLRLLSV